MMKVYEYPACSTCKKALKFLETRKIKFEKIPIVEKPPKLSELKKMLEYLREDGGDLKNLFNTSGVQYRELGIAQKLKEGMSEKDALALLAKNGKLIKRPFILTDRWGVVGFKEERLKTLLS